MLCMVMINALAEHEIVCSYDLIVYFRVSLWVRVFCFCLQTSLGSLFGFVLCLL